MIVVITEDAKNDLMEIGDFIRPNSPKRAASFIRELLDACETLADMPRAFPLVPRYEHYGIRRRAYHNYLIFYRVKEELIEIIRVLHGARDYEAILFFEE